MSAQKETTTVSRQETPPKWDSSRRISSSCSENEIIAQRMRLVESEVYNVSSCQQLVIKLAKGQEVSLEERIRLVLSIRSRITANANAAKALKDHLLGDSTLRQSFVHLIPATVSVDRLIRLWDRFYCELLPNLQSVLYPFEECETQQRPKLRNVILAAFRDAVIMNERCYELLARETMAISHSPTKDSERMLLLLEENTRDNSKSWLILKSLCQRHVDGFETWETADCLQSKLHYSLSVSDLSTGVRSVSNNNKHRFSIQNSPKLLRRLLAQM